MRKLYTDKDYFDMACQANAEGKSLIKVQEEVQVPYEVYEYEKKINYKLAYLLHESGHGYHLMRGHVDI